MRAGSAFAAKSGAPAARRGAFTAKLALAATIACAALLAGCASDDFEAPEIATGRKDRQVARATRDMVVAAHPLAVDAGVAMLARGGSAVDAAIAAQLVLNLVEPQSSGIGGGGFLLHHDARSGRLGAFDGRETAPAAATPELLLDAQGRERGRMAAIDGGLSVGTPGLLRMLELAHRRHGRLPWAELFAPAIRLAEEGFAISPRMAASVAAAARRICAQPAAREYFLLPGGCAPKPAGTRLANPAFAETLRNVAKGGADAFYRGPIARAIADAARSHPTNPGRLATTDLESYRALEREPLCGPYRGARICGMPPPSSGALVVLQTLGILSLHDVRALGPGSVDEVHLASEAMRLAYADRARWVADPDFVRVPVAGMLEPRYLRERAALIRPDRAMGAPVAGRPAGAPEVGADASAPRPSTTHLSVLDRDGNLVSMTSSIEHAFGSLQMVGGFLLNNQLTDFSARPSDETGRPAANRVEPGKRPRSTMTPVIVYDAQDRPLAALGSPGGVAIAAFVTKTLSGLLDRDLTIQQAIDAPNFVAETTTTTWLERGTALEAVADGLRARGHRVALADLPSGVHGLVIRRTGWGPARIEGGADPRREGVARGSDAAAQAPARSAAPAAGTAGPR